MLRPLTLCFTLIALGSSAKAEIPAPPEPRRGFALAFVSSLLTDGATDRLDSFANRVVRITTETSNPHGSQVGAASQCPDLEHDVPVGGDCAAGDGATIVETRITWASGVASFWCRFRQPDDNAAPVVVSVLCLRNAR